MHIQPWLAPSYIYSCFPIQGFRAAPVFGSHWLPSPGQSPTFGCIMTSNLDKWQQPLLRVPSGMNCNFSFCSGPSSLSPLPRLVNLVEDGTKVATVSFHLARETTVVLFVVALIGLLPALRQEQPRILFPVDLGLLSLGPLLYLCPPQLTFAKE